MSLAKEGGLECRTVVLGGALGGGGCSELSELANTATVNATVWGYVGTDKNALCYEAVHRRSYFKTKSTYTTTSSCSSCSNNCRSFAK